MKPENPTAFPFVEPSGGCSVTHGMSLRDYFAAKALAALILVADQYTADPQTSAPIDGWDDLASAAYQASDAMLAARGKEGA